MESKSNAIFKILYKYRYVPLIASAATLIIERILLHLVLKIDTGTFWLWCVQLIYAAYVYWSAIDSRQERIEKLGIYSWFVPFSLMGVRNWVFLIFATLILIVFVVSIIIFGNFSRTWGEIHIAIFCILIIINTRTANGSFIKSPDSQSLSVGEYLSNERKISKQQQIDFRYSNITTPYLVMSMVIAPISGLIILFFMLHWHIHLGGYFWVMLSGMVLLSLIHIRERRCTAIFHADEMILKWKRKTETIAYRDIYNVRYIVKKGYKNRERYTIIIKTRAKKYIFRSSLAENPKFWESKEENPSIQHSFYYLQKELARRARCGIERKSKMWYNLW